MADASHSKPEAEASQHPTGHPPDDGRAAWIDDCLSLQVSPAAIIAQGVQKYQVRSKEMRRAVKLAIAARRREAELDPEDRRTSLYNSFRTVFRLAVRKGNFGIALRALEDVVALYGCNPASKADLNISGGLDLEGGAVTNLPALKQRIATLLKPSDVKKGDGN
jgi:hypothetical protein